MAAPHGKRSPSLQGERTVSEESQPEVGQEQSCPRLLCEGGGATSPHSFHKDFYSLVSVDGKEGMCLGS